MNGKNRIFLRQHRKLVLIILLLMPAAAILAALEPLLLKHVLDRLSSNAGIASLLIALAAVAVAGFFRFLRRVSGEWLDLRLGMSIKYQLQYDPRYDGGLIGNGEATGRLAAMVNDGIKRCSTAVSELAFGLFPGIVYLSVAGMVMLKLDRRLAMLVFSFSLVHLGIASLWKSSLVRRFTRPGFKGSLFFCGILLAAKGEATLGTMIAFFCYHLGVAGPVRSLSRLVSTMRRAAAMGRLTPQMHPEG